MTKFTKLYKELLIPAALLSALIIGAGMFSLPFIFNRAGIVTGIFYLVALTLVLAAVHLMYAEVIGRTPGDHRFVGYAKIHLGKAGFILSIFTAIFTIILVLLIYLVLAPSFFRLIFPGMAPLTGVLLFWLVGTMAVLAGVKKMASLESGIVVVIILFVLALFFSGITSPDFHPTALPLYNSGFIFLPFGAVLFSLGGRAAISSIREYFRKEKISEKRFPAAIILGTALPAVVYLFFVIGVISFSKGMVTEDAVSGIVFSPFLLKIFGVVGLLTLWTSYVFLGLELRGIFRLDFKIKKIAADSAVVFLPLAIYLAGVSDFIVLVGVAGGIFSGLESVLVVSMWQKLKKRLSPAFFLIPVFLAGAVYEAIKHLS